MTGNPDNTARLVEVARDKMLALHARRAASPASSSSSRILRYYDVTISIGDSLRPGYLADASDRAQFAERLRDSTAQSLPHFAEQLDGISHEPVRPPLKNVVPALRVYPMGHQTRMVPGQAFVLVGDGQVVTLLLWIENHR